MKCHLVIAVLVTASSLALGSPVASAEQNGWELPALSVPAAQAISKGDGITVAVLDSGIRIGHPVLQGRATEGPDFLSAEGDKSQPWYGGHGTAMASSVLDVAPDAKVLGLRVLRDNDDPSFQTWLQTMQAKNPSGNARPVSKAIRYAADNGAQVISMSLGSRISLGAYGSDEMRAIHYALGKGVVVIASGGNEGDEDNQVAYPAAYPGVIAVAASKPDGSRAEFSSVHDYVDVAAPGVGINGADSTTTGRTPGNGTSPAAALTAGVAALILAKYPKLAPRQVEQLLEHTASTYGQGYNPLTGYGVINAEAALRAAVSLQPESPALAIGKEGTGIHFGPGDDGTRQKVQYGLDSSYVTFAAILAAPGLLMLIGGWLLLRRGQRAERRWPAGAR
ncbi:S8 family serine peptidase [Nocardia sp. NBC_01730]|uniref:S8 family serine peptidase n=1 Tax=Nocardia sp. NBC_01730 TaxID=2975998 RepID=UPI002E10F613|nr:S8 family serine peptidase [Nocardia sp. NBC_01730]